MKTINNYYQKLKNKGKQKTQPPQRLKLLTWRKEGPKVQTGPWTPGDWGGDSPRLPVRPPAQGTAGGGATPSQVTLPRTLEELDGKPGGAIFTPGHEAEQSRGVLLGDVCHLPCPHTHPLPDTHTLCT